MVHLSGAPELAAVEVGGTLPVHRPLPLEGEDAELVGVRPWQVTQSGQSDQRPGESLQQRRGGGGQYLVYSLTFGCQLVKSLLRHF